MIRGSDQSALGKVLSPNVDRLAAMGTTFLNTYNQNPSCAPIRTLMHTGRYSHRTGVYGFEYYTRSTNLIGILLFPMFCVAKQAINAGRWETWDSCTRSHDGS